MIAKMNHFKFNSLSLIFIYQVQRDSYKYEYIKEVIIYSLIEEK